MAFIDILEKRFGKYAPANITYYLISGQVLAFIIVYFYPQYTYLFVLKGNLLLKGEWWRIIAFLFSPLSDSLLFVAFVWYIFYVYGISLEQQWGSFRYMVYLSISYIGTLIIALLFPDMSLSNGYLYTSLFLAFAYMYPNFRLYIFFVIPVKVKWLALIAWIALAVEFFVGSLATKVIILVSISNFLLFFGNHLVYSLPLRLKGISRNMSKSVASHKPHHTCALCGKDEIKDPAMEIRYCETCTPTTCYCGDHIRKHTHKTQ